MLRWLQLQLRTRSRRCPRLFASSFFTDWDSADLVNDVVRRWIESAESPEARRSDIGLLLIKSLGVS